MLYDQIVGFVSLPHKRCCILFREHHQLQEVSSKYRGVYWHTQMLAADSQQLLVLGKSVITIYTWNKS